MGPKRALTRYAQVMFLARSHTKYLHVSTLDGTLVKGFYLLGNMSRTQLSVSKWKAVPLGILKALIRCPGFG